MSDPVDVIAAKLHELVLANNGVSRGLAEMRSDAAALASTIADECPIVWRPIRNIPFALKGSGRDILTWCDGCAMVGHWSDSGPHSGNWLDHDGEPAKPTHYAAINEPDA